jgi:PilZ domain
MDHSFLLTIAASWFKRSRMVMSERRQSSRQRRSLEGRIGYDGRFRLRCLVLNISPGGAKLSLKASSQVPAEFFFSISGTNFERVYWASTKWRRGNVLGVAFGEAPASGEPLLGIRRGHGSYRA